MPPGMMSKLLKISGVAAVALLSLAAQIKRGEGVSNLSHWLGWTGLELPSAMQTPLADNWVSGIGLALLSALVFWWTFKPDARSAAANARPSRPVARYPDWSIGALFLYLEPGLAEVDDIEKHASATGGVVLAKLASGELQAWGKLDGSSTALRPIDPAFWQQASWTYWFLPGEKRNRELVHATLPRAAQQYRDIHVNHAEAMAVWKKEH
jgi:hypothetical protein